MKLKQIGMLVLPLLFVAAGFFVITDTASAAACTNGSNYGTATMTVNIPVAGDYRIWTRMKVPSAAASTYQLEANGNTCWQVGGSNVPTNTWTWVDWYGGNGSQKVNYNFTTTGNHTLKLIGAATDVQVDKVILLGSGEQCSDGSTTPSGDGANCASAPAPPSISSFTATPATVTVGSSSKLDWTTTNTTSCSVTPGGPTDTTSKTWTPLAYTTTGTKTYTLTCKNATGATATATKSVTVNAAATPPSSVTLTAGSTSVTSGTTVLLKWTSVGGTSCTLNPGNITASGSGSSTNVVVTATTAYTATCSNTAGSSKSPVVTVTVTASPPAVVPAPVITSFAAASTNIAYGEIAKLTWSASNVITNGCALTSSLNTTPVPYPASSGYSSAALTSSVSYTLTCKNSAGVTVNKSVSISVANKPVPAAPAPAAAAAIPTAKAPETTGSTNKVDAPTGEQVVEAQTSRQVTRGELISLDTSTITDQAKIDSVLKIEFYSGEELIDTVTSAPFALDSKKLNIGNQTITQRTYFKDGSIAEQSQLLEVMGAQDVEGALAANGKNGAAQGLFVGIGSILALIVAVSAAGWFFVLRPGGYSVLDAPRLVVEKIRSVTNHTTVTTQGTPDVSRPPASTPTQNNGYAEPTIITPDKKDV